MGKKRRNLNYKEDIRSFFSPPKRAEVDPEVGSGDAQGEELNNQDRNMTPRRSILKDLNHKPKIKTEEAAGSEAVHSHEFLLKFDNSDLKYTIQCDHPQTVLQAITSKPEIQEKIKCEDDKIVLQKGEAHMGTAIATHFPCTLLKDGELVTLTEKKELVEVRDKEGDYRVYQDKRYYVVNIDIEGGTKRKSKLFKSRCIKTFSQLSVYGTENMTLKEAIERDGRFMDFGDFQLGDFMKGKVYVFSYDKIPQHDGKAFRIYLKKHTQKASEASSKDTDEAVPQKTGEAASEKASETSDTAEAGPSSAGTVAVPTTRWVLVSDVLKENQASDCTKKVEDIYKLLRAQFPELKKQLLSRNSAETLKKTLRKVDFGKAQQTFSEVGRVKELFEMAESVCKITVGNVCEGTGFVLFERYVLTNAHLFNKVMYNNSVRPDIDITAKFNYEKQNQTNTINFKVRNTFIDYDRELDYAVLELVVSEGDESLVAPGLMKHCCPMPESGEACIVGHPNGEVKQFDPTCIIEKEKRRNEVNKHLQQFDQITLMSVEQAITGQGIERILSPPDPIYKQTASYHTFMYHGSSGSPVFDAHCKVFGLHTAGFSYGFGPKKAAS
uniref:Protein FAM111A-like n=1 Tax=Neogobius melanostomus TaxID=47308 RepID=A0A8C6SMZ6_9GOBI